MIFIKKEIEHKQPKYMVVPNLTLVVEKILYRIEWIEQFIQKYQDVFPTNLFSSMHLDHRAFFQIELWLGAKPASQPIYYLVSHKL